MTTVEVPRWSDGERAAWRPPAKLAVSEWADTHRWLDPRFSPEGGRYSTMRTPYAREWQDCASMPWVRQVTIIAGTQSGKSEALNNVAGYAIHQDPGPIIVVVPRNQDVRTASQRRIVPMIEACQVLREELTDSAQDVKNVEIAFRRCFLYLRAATSPADLASTPARFLLCDEVDKWPEWSGDEAAPLELVRERSKNYWNRICYVTTTPTTPTGVGWREFEEGDRRRYWVPCPHCAHWQQLLFRNIVFPKDATAHEVERRDLARYVCPNCERDIDDGLKGEMLARGSWIPEAITVEEWLHGDARRNDREAYRSYHLWSGYSPWCTWSRIASQWLRSQGDPKKLMNWTNSWLAEPWEDRVEAPTQEQVDAAKVKGFRHGTVPDGVLVLTAGVDVQADRLWVVVRGWGYDDHAWLVFAGSVKDFDELEDLLFRQPWLRARLGLKLVFVDSRHRRPEVMEFARNHRSVVRMAQGVDREGPVDFTTQKLEKHPDTGQPLASSLLIWSITVARFKDQVAERQANPSLWHIPEDVPDAYKRQVASEHKVRRRSRARERMMWIARPGHDANHCWDCEVYAMAAAKAIRVELLRTGGDDVDAGAAPSSPPPRGERIRRRRDGGGGGFPRLSR